MPSESIVRKRSRRAIGILLALGLAGAGCTGGGGNGAPGTGRQEKSLGVLATVKERGKLNCGVNNAVPGFGFVDAEGKFSGFDVDFCRAVAAAVLGDANAVEYKPLTADQRFTALQGGEIDVLIRNTTWIANRDGGEGAAFTTTSFYDGQGMMVRERSRFRRLEDMQNTTICVLTGTTTELNLASQFAARNIRYESLSLDKPETIQENFIQGRCDGWTSDKSQLAGISSNFPQDQGGPDSLRILPETMSKEPLGPVVRDGDSKWFDAVNWTVIATIQAEEFGISSANVDQTRTSSANPEVKRFLGVPLKEGDPAFDPKLGLPVDYAYRVVKQVGNYAEIYDRNIGSRSRLGLARGVNALWTQGGLLYAPPYR